MIIIVPFVSKVAEGTVSHQRSYGKPHSSSEDRKGNPNNPSFLDHVREIISASTVGPADAAKITTDNIILFIKVVVYL